MNLTETIKRFVGDFIFSGLPNNYSMCEESNILGLYDDRFIITKAENFVAGITLEGINYNTFGEQEGLETLLARINSLNALSDNVEARIVAKRRQLIYNQEYNIDNIYARNIINAWEKYEKVYVNEYFIILETKNKGAKGFFEKKKLELTTSIKEDEGNNVTYVNKINILKAVVERMTKTLSQYEIKEMTSLELLRFYAEYINGVYIPIQATNGLLSDSYIASNVSFHKDYFIQDYNGNQTFNRFIGIKAYDCENITSLIVSSILHSNIEFDIFLSIDTISKEKAQGIIKSKINFAPSLIKPALHELRELINSDRLFMQNFSFAVLVKAKDKEQLNEDSMLILNTFRNYGLVAVTETLNMQPTFFSMFPNKSFLNARKRIHTSSTISSMILFEKEYVGKVCNSWGETPITIFKNQSQSPFLFNFHANEDDYVVGHTMIVGGTGAGKTTLLSFLIANLFKYDIDILALDRLNGLYAITEYLNGEYNVGEDFSINPFSLPNDKENISFLGAWICQMVGLDVNATNELEAQKIKAIEKGVEDLYYNVIAAQGYEANLKDFKESVVKTNDEQIRIQLEKYQNNSLFNSIKDSLDFNKKLTTLNMDFIVNNEKDAALIAQYLFQKLTYKAKTTAKGTFIFIDEFKSYLSNETFNDRINITLTQMRKLNSVMAMALQDLHQLNGVKNADSFLRNIAHIIIFPTKDIDVFENYNIHLTSNEMAFLLNTGQNERKILLKNLINGQSNILDVNLAKLGKYLKVLSSDSKVVQKIKSIKLNNQINWRERFLNE